MFRIAAAAYSRDVTLGELAGTGDGCSVEVSAGRESAGPLLTVSVTADGLRLAEPGPAGARARQLSWEEVRRLVRTGEVAPTCRWGLVIEGTLEDVFPDLQHACDKAAEARMDGRKATLIRVPVAADPVAG